MNYIFLIFPLGNKLTDRHIKYRENIQNARLAIQVLSNSVADALELPYEKRKKLFQDWVGTVKFCRMFNQAYEILNVRSLFGDTIRHEYAKPLKSSTIDFLKESAEEVVEYIRGLKDYQGTPLVSYSRKCAFVGFITCLKNIFPLFEQL